MMGAVVVFPALDFKVSAAAAVHNYLGLTAGPTPAARRLADLLAVTAGQLNAADPARYRAVLGNLSRLEGEV